jgi:hypothetical protein
MTSDLENRIAALESWQKARQSQQIVFPLDAQSVTILNNYFMSIVGTIVYTNANGLDFTNWLVKQGATGGVIGIGLPLFRFTANATTNTLTVGLDVINNNQGYFNDDNQVFVTSTDTLPAPLVTAFPYYVVNAGGGGTTVQLSLTQGGAAIDLTTAGTGEQFIQFLS